MLHKDRGNESNNKIIDEVLQTFGFKRSLSTKGFPYDNAIIEATFKIIKMEFVQNAPLKVMNRYSSNWMIMSIGSITLEFMEHLMISVLLNTK